MSKPCPILGVAIYLDCLECEDKLCRKQEKKNVRGDVMPKIIIGVDPSYKNTGISICVDGRLKAITSLRFSKSQSNSEKRNLLSEKMEHVISNVCLPKSKDITVIIERIRLSSEGYINMDYIKGVGALNAVIIDVASRHNIKTFSVDTRAWKANVVGTSKPQANKYGIDPKKWPTIKYIVALGFEDRILSKVSNSKKKGVVKIIDGQKYIYNDDAADSACIALYGFLPESVQRLQIEK